MENSTNFKQLLGDKYVDPYVETDKNKIIQAIDDVLNARPNFCPKRKHNIYGHLSSYCKAHNATLLDETYFIENYNGLQLYVIYNIKTKIKKILIDRPYEMGTVNNRMSITNLRGILKGCMKAFERQAVYLRWQKYGHLYVNEAQTPTDMFHKSGNDMFEAFRNVRYDSQKDEMFWTHRIIKRNRDGEITTYQTNGRSVGVKSCINSFKRIKEKNNFVSKNDIYDWVRESTQHKIQKLKEIEEKTIQKVEEWIEKPQENLVI